MTNELRASITAAFQYLDSRGIPIPSNLQITARLKGIKAGKPAGDLSEVNKTYHDAITSILTDYFENGGSITAPRNSFRMVMVEAFGSAFDLGWVDGGQELPFTGEALEWFNARVEQETGFISMLFQEAKELRKEEEFDWFAWATARADSYTQTLASIYNAARMWADKNQMLAWKLGKTEKHCDTCKGLNGKSHRASWYLARNYIPRQPGAAMDCHGYNCDCELKNKEGKTVTI